ncbi:hypothetical protein I5E68_17210 [Novosphingobium sp. YJ-S2-02]|uniref:Uncharacterized protein n=1 Tax=Novosphingobium aureum TaxID=2792964 RepID=A0A931HEJ9_9SPHN|nr:hypothetical protein [Novosphingobium aureum]MBH0114690.1 hypothetical protein [Novosphingobium aureum]
MPSDFLIDRKRVHDTPKPARSLTSSLAAPLACLLAASSTLVLGAPAHAAKGPSFELAGPDLRVDVTRDGKSLPIAQVPSLAEGDKVTVHGAMPEDHGAEFILVSAFLRGATNPPPKDWIETAESWKEKEKKNTLALTVPKGARQMVLLLVPDTGGAEGVLRDAVRGKPGEFVRASHDLELASLDHTRLETFMAGIRAEIGHPQNLRKIAPPLANALGIKLNEDCLLRVAEEQASCLLEDRENLVLGDVHSNSITDTLTGAPTALALQLSAVPEAGGGTYSPYIGVVRDVAKLLGAFSNPTFNYLPALTTAHDDRLSLLLNAAPSFQKPKTVMVAAMPSIEASRPPRLRASDAAPVCLARPGAVLPVEGAPLVFSTAFAHDMAVTITSASGRTVEVPVAPQADKGGYRLDAPLPEGLSGAMRARLHGLWGFTPFEGPEFAVQLPGVAQWKLADGGTGLVVGRDNRIVVEGSAPACLSGVTLRRKDGSPQRLVWEVESEGRLAVKVPGDALKTGKHSLELQVLGAAEPVRLDLEAVAEGSRIDGFEVHAGDDEGLLTGLRLDQVKSLELGKRRFVPAELTRAQDADLLRLVADGETGAAAEDLAQTPEGETETAWVTLASGRKVRLPVTVASPRPKVHLLDRSVRTANAKPGEHTLDLGKGELLPDDGELVFSIDRAGEGAFDRSDAIEIALAPQGPGTEPLTPLTRLEIGKGLSLATAQVAVATLRASDLPPGTFGPLRFRLLRGGDTGSSSLARSSDWQPLASLVRLPRVTALTCNDKAATASATPCTLRGRDLFLLDAVGKGSEMTGAVKVSPGFTGAAIAVPQPGADGLGLRLRDAPESVVTLTAD